MAPQDIGSHFRSRTHKEMTPDVLIMSCLDILASPVNSRLVLYVAFALSGAAALLYEITWTRWLTLFMGHTVAAASTVLAAFMGGLAIGAAIGGRVALRLSLPAALRAYAALELVIALLAITLPFELSLFEPLLARAYANGHGGATFAAVRLACALAVVTLPAVAMGATLPLVVRGSVHLAARAGRETGWLYALNTLGAATGAFAGGFVAAACSRDASHDARCGRAECVVGGGWVVRSAAWP